MHTVHHVTGRRLLCLILSLMLILAASQQAARGQGQAVEVDQLRSTFSAAIDKPLAERTVALETVERQIDRQLHDGAGGEERVDLQWLRFRVKQSLAKHPETEQAFGDYISTLRQTLPNRQTKAIVQRVVTKMKPWANPMMAEPLLREALEAASDDPDVTPYLLLRHAESLERLPGRRDEGIPLVERLIGEYPDSAHRPAAMRLLAKLQVIKGDDKAALQTLSRSRCGHGATCCVCPHGSIGSAPLSRCFGTTVSSPAAKGNNTTSRSG